MAGGYLSEAFKKLCGFPLPTLPGHKNQPPVRGNRQQVLSEHGFRHDDAAECVVVVPVLAQHPADHGRVVVVHILSQVVLHVLPIDGDTEGSAGVLDDVVDALQDLGFNAGVEGDVLGIASVGFLLGLAEEGHPEFNGPLFHGNFCQDILFLFLYLVELLDFLGSLPLFVDIIVVVVVCLSILGVRN